MNQNSTFVLPCGNFSNNTWRTGYSSRNWKPGQEPVDCQHFNYIPEVNHPILAVFLFIFCFLTIIGSSMVILAVIQERNLHSPTNYFITSLAVADLLVGLVVMPFSAWQEVQTDKSWVFGHLWCDLWHALDIFTCTASILHLCVISMDRYWAITDPLKYRSRMSNRRVACLILAIWVITSALSFPFLWWIKTSESWTKLLKEKSSWECINVSMSPQLTEHLTYRIILDILSFYGPLTVMIFTYIQVFRVAQMYKKNLQSGAKHVGFGAELRIHRGGGKGTKNQDTSDNAQMLEKSETKKISTQTTLAESLLKFNKDKKAAITLGIVMGVFIICWFPFFVTSLINTTCKDCISHPEIVMTTLTWLGWINSCMNPFIYACRTPEFRRAFSRYLCFCWS